MFFLKENPESIVEICKEAPNVGTPYMFVDKKKPIPFYINDSAMNQIVGGYQKGPENSYAKELAEKYPLCNE